jgi:hypothetical protein
MWHRMPQIILIQRFDYSSARFMTDLSDLSILDCSTDIHRTDSAPVRVAGGGS